MTIVVVSLLSFSLPAVLEIFDCILSKLVIVIDLLSHQLSALTKTSDRLAELLIIY